MGNNNSSDSGFKNFLILVLLVVVGYMAWKSGLLSTLLPDDPQVVQPTAVVVPQQVPREVPQVIVTATPALSQPDYIPVTPTAATWFATAVPSSATGVAPGALADVIQKTVSEMEACVKQQMNDPHNNYHCENYKLALENLREIASQIEGNQ